MSNSTLLQGLQKTIILQEFCIITSIKSIILYMYKLIDNKQFMFHTIELAFVLIILIVVEFAFFSL